MVTSLQSLLASILHSSYSTVAQLLLVTGLQSRSALISQVISMCSSFPPSTSSRVFHLMLPTTSHWVLTVGKSTSFSTIEHSSHVTGVHFSVPAHTLFPLASTSQSVRQLFLVTCLHSGSGTLQLSHVLASLLVLLLAPLDHLRV